MACARAAIVVGFGHAWREDAVRARVGVQPCAPDGLLHRRLARGQAAQVDVGPRVDEEARRPPRSAAARACSILATSRLGRAAAVLQVDPHRPGLDHRGHHLAHLVRVVGVAALDVGAHRDRHHARGLADGREQHLQRQGVAVRIAVRPSDPGAGGGDGLGAQALDQPRAAGVPGVGQPQDLRAGVKVAEDAGAFGMGGHWRISSGYCTARKSGLALKGAGRLARARSRLRCSPMTMTTTAAAADTARPVQPGRRIEAIDALRGFALCGILLVNILAMGGPIEWDHPQAPPDLSDPDWQVFWAGVLFVEGAMRGLFSVLFGAGMLLFLREAGAAGVGQDRTRLFMRRAGWLAVFGLVNGTILLWPGDILLIYAIAAFAILPFAKATPRTLLTIAGGLILFLVVWSAPGGDRRRPAHAGEPRPRPGKDRRGADRAARRLPRQPRLHGAHELELDRHARLPLVDRRRRRRHADRHGPAEAAHPHRRGAAQDLRPDGRRRLRHRPAAGPGRGLADLHPLPRRPAARRAPWSSRGASR